MLVITVPELPEDWQLGLKRFAVATAATSSDFVLGDFLRHMRASLSWFTDLLQDTSKFNNALDAIEVGIERGATCLSMSETLGTGITAYEAVPMALYCFLSHPESYERVIHEAVFIGGDTDTIASMAGAISGAFLGASAIPTGWREAVREEAYPLEKMERLADHLFQAYVRK